MNPDEEIDIPYFSLTDREENGYCMECGKRKAKFQCDYITGKSFDLPKKGMIKECTCDWYLCEKCTNKLDGFDYCPKHFKLI